jgi:hypothetical protein
VLPRGIPRVVTLKATESDDVELVRAVAGERDELVDHTALYVTGAVIVDPSV